MMSVPPDLRRALEENDQAHVLSGWNGLGPAARRRLVEQLRQIDLAALGRMFEQRDVVFPVPAAEQVSAVPAARLEGQRPEVRRLGDEALHGGEVAILVVAGGQGSRLGFERPKGMFPIGPVSNKTLFQIHSEKVLALVRRYGQPVPFLILTSRATHEETQTFFRQNGYFGLPAEEVSFVQQGTLPALDLDTGRLLLEAPGRIFTSPNGHGGVLAALRESGQLDSLQRRGVRQLFYFQVDNPVVKVAEPAFLAHHLAVGAEASSKVVPKDGPDDKLGNLVLVSGRCTIIEYSDLPADLARQTESSGRLRLWAGSPAIHWFSLDFLRRMSGPQRRLPYHVARKKVRYWSEATGFAEPARENALKFEMFIFDVLPQAERWTVVETERASEFVPLKNASGPDSPAAVRRALTDLAASWLERAGIAVPRTAGGAPAYPLEVSPLYALDAEEFAAKVERRVRLEGPTYFV